MSDVTPAKPDETGGVRVLSVSREAIRAEATFLLDRLDELDWSGTLDSTARDFEGHVYPAMSRLRSLLSAPEHGERTI